MEFLNLCPEQLEKQHICCAMSNRPATAAKKAWLKQRLAEGLVFRRLDVNGKVFIEYLPAEAAWCPIQAPGYYYIDCFWVAGKYQGQGYATQLLDYACQDVEQKGGKGLVVLSAAQKKPFLSDPSFLNKKGFLLADTAPPDYHLLYFPFAAGGPPPAFLPHVKAGGIKEQELILYYSNQCPYAETYAVLLQQTAQKNGRSLTLRKLTSRQQAQQAPCPFTTFSLFYQGRLLTSEILSEKKFQRLLRQLDEEKG